MSQLRDCDCDCCWSPDLRLWSCFSFWMPENIHPSSASLAESSSDGFKGTLEAEAGRREWELGKLVTLGGWVIFILTATTTTTSASCGGSHGKCRCWGLPWLVCSTKTNCCCSLFFYLWPSLSLRCFLVLTCCTGRDEKVFLFHHSLWQEFPCSSLTFCPCGHSRT